MKKKKMWKVEIMDVTTNEFVEEKISDENNNDELQI
jgi:hypothetical protein